MQCVDAADSAQSETDMFVVGSSESQLTMLSVAALNSEVTSPKSMQLAVEIQGHQMLFLVDSGSSPCFIDSKRAAQLSGRQPLVAPIHVKIAGGAILQCAEYFPHLEWSAAGTLFSDQFRILSLGSYDGIIGLDWLAKHRPMTTHWE